MSLTECFSDFDPHASERQGWYREAGIGSGVVVNRRPPRPVLHAAGYRCWQELPLGQVLGVTRLTDASETEDLAPHLTAQELAFGDYGLRRWGWHLELLRRFEQPFPAKGSLGIWTWEAPEGVLEGLS